MPLWPGLSYFLFSYPVYDGMDVRKKFGPLAMSMSSKLELEQKHPQNQNSVVI